MANGQLETDVVELRVVVARLETVVERLEDGLLKFVTKDQFLPVKLIAYGIAGGTLFAVLTAILITVIRR